MQEHGWERVHVWKTLDTNNRIRTQFLEAQKQSHVAVCSQHPIVIGPNWDVIVFTGHFFHSLQDDAVEWNID